MMTMDADGWSKIISTIFAGLKDLALVGVSLYTIQVQYANSGKLDVVTEKATAAAVEASEAKETLHASVKERRAEMAALGAKIDGTPMAAAAPQP
jgi:hypothetical protein